MIVMQYTFQIKPGKLDEALKLAKDGRKNIWPTVNGRIYSSNIGPMNTIVIENEHKDITEQLKHSKQVIAKEAWGPWETKWNELVTGQSANHVWNVE